MMKLSETVQSLLDNEKSLSVAAVNSLLKITNNILSHPNDEKYRRINLSSDVVEKYILPAVGALELLFLMGFEEGDDKLVLPFTSSLDMVLMYRDELEALKKERFLHATNQSSVFGTSNQKATNKKNKSKITSEAYFKLIANEPDMKKELILRSQSVLQFENASLQEKARSIIPLQELNKKAKEKAVPVTEDLPASEQSLPLDFQDYLLLELMSWFKEEYFSWFDQGFCEICQKNMKFSKYVSPSLDDINRGASTVELHRCESCEKEEKFPRLSNPGELMKTRKGRCMEWAACFTFFCRCLGFDARYVVDETDHVWTEVFSKSQDRWLHADSCENKLDTPLLYEKGWGKKLSYIFAYSKDEIVDCVWRYSTNHKEVCQRRTRCREDWLASTIFSLNQEKQSMYSPEKRRFLEQRLVKEIVEFMNPYRKENEGESEGRASGSLAWRLSRGDVNAASSSLTFTPSENELKNKEMIVKYSAARDVYICPLQNNTEIKGWQNGTFTYKGVFRKYERDWKISYIARNEGCAEGTVSWKFDWSNHKDLKLKSVLIVVQHKIYENGSVHLQLCSGNLCFTGNKDGILDLSSGDLEGNANHIQLSVVLSGGIGDVAWQQAQLFRQGENDKEFPLFIHLKFE